MAGSIYLRDDSGKFVEMKQQDYRLEEYLQHYLEEHPSLLAGEQITPDAPRQWLLVGREIAIPEEHYGGGRWSLDLLYVDQDGVPTLVEVKRSSDPRIRREVVAQMLDYAANAKLFWGPDYIRDLFEKSPGSPDKIRETFGPDCDETKLWESVERNLRSGRLRLVFVGDKIPIELQRIVEFLNEQMKPADVLAVEIVQYVDESSGRRHVALVPRLIGQTAEAQARKIVGDQKTEIYREFWRQLLEKASLKTTLFVGKALSTRQWLGIPLERRGIGMSFLILAKSSALEIYVDFGTDSKDKNKATFDRFASQAQTIEAQLGAKLSWERLEDGRASKIRWMLQTAGLDDQDKWDETQQVMIDSMIVFEKVWRPIVQALKN